MKKIITGIAAGFALLSVVGVAQAALLTPSASGKVVIPSVSSGTPYAVETQYDVDYIYTLDSAFSDYPLDAIDEPYNDFASIELSDIGNSVFDLFLWESGGWNNIAQLGGAFSASYDFASGVDLFRIAVNTLDQPVAPFATGLTFTKDEDGTVFYQNVDAREDDSSPIPEPATFLLIGAGLLGMGWRRKKN